MLIRCRINKKLVCIVFAFSLTGVLRHELSMVHDIVQLSFQLINFHVIAIPLEQSIPNSLDIRDV